MPHLVDKSGKVLKKYPYDAAGMREANRDQKGIPGSHVVHSNDYDPQEYSQEAQNNQMVQQQESMDEKFEGTPSPFGDHSSGLGGKRGY